MAPPKFKDFLKEPKDLLSDDFINKKVVKMKCKAGGVTFKTADTLKTDGLELKSVSGKIEANFKVNGVSIDKLVFNGSDIALDLVYPFMGVNSKLKTELKGKDGATPFTFEADKKTPMATAFGSFNSASKVDLSLTGAFKPFCFGGAVTYLADKGVLAGYDAGAAYSAGPLKFGATTTKKFAGLSFGALYKVSPVLSCALTCAYPKTQDSVVVGGTFKVSDVLTTKTKITKDTVEFVMMNKCCDGLKGDFGLTLPFKDTFEKYAIGLQISLG